MNRKYRLSNVDASCTKRTHIAAVMTTAAVLSVLVAAAALRFGSASLSFADFFRALFREPGYETYTVILYHIRLPRVAGGILAGVGLATAGVLLQSVTANDLAGPNIIGVNAGAGFAVILLLTFFPHAFLLSPLAAFVGAFLVTLVIVAVGNRAGGARNSVIFAGIAVTAVLNAGISFFSLLDADVLASYNHFSVGGLAGVSMDSLLIPSVICAAGLLVTLLLARRIDLLCLGDTLAASLGVRVKVLRTVCFVLASALAAAVVSYAGLLGFVGLVVPHIARKLVGCKTGVLVGTSALIGSITVTLADLLGRVLFAPTEIPVGIMMAVIGAPFFLALLLRKGRDF